MSEKQKLRCPHDTIVECQTCGRRQHLQFINGLRNGWSKCCGYTMRIKLCNADIEDAVGTIVKEAMKGGEIDEG